ncbi:putative secreted protein (Por secretion system target) [Chryseobacterium sp. 7]|uniref:endonuclease n=1 Tax=Chryseobacterium sp. 7 TaxID=2035214 RepID=UPI000EABE3BC|nr:endonuclease [Chryseobacterium sp. 7]RLJ23521.1 putative secreted protein (Por secretion system target) [Chryseobacterium sp. 7]
MKRILSFFLLSFVFINGLAQIPAGYYNAAAGLNGAPLKTALKQIITTGHATNITYNDVWSAYQTTDRDYDYDNDGTILDIYSETPVGPDQYNFIYGPTDQCGSSGYSSEGDCYNREHVVPQSLFNEGLPMRSDVHFIRATDGKVNNERGNLPYGKVGTYNYISQNGSKRGNSVSPGYSGVVFEPIDEFKGDIARMIFYFVTRYESQLSGFSTGNMLAQNTYPSLQDWELNQLLLWNTQDPVSASEIRRNNATYAFQGNRNPYIDHPEYVNMVWGTPVVDTQAPTVPTNLIANNPTSNSIAVSWTASTDNVGVTSYEVYANGALKATVSGTTTSTVVSGLSPLTQYTFYVIAKDAAGNSSAQSNNAVETTLDGPAGGGSCGTEDFSTMQDGTSQASQYATRTWTNNNITWTATLARTDETINGKSVCIRKGTLTSSVISGGVQTLTLTTQRKYGGNNDNLNVLVNDVLVGTVPYSTTVATTTITVGVSGNAVIKIVNPNDDRVAMDDLSWTCATSLATVEAKKDKSEFIIYPNPVRNNELFIKGENLSKVLKADIYDLSGKLIETIENPFRHSNKINLKNLVKGTYILKTDNFSTKFIVN